MIFKDKRLETGDIIIFRTKLEGVPGEIRAAVIDITRDGVLQVFSNELAFSNCNGKFKETDVTDINVAETAVVAIPKESDTRRFANNQRVFVNLRSLGKKKGVVIAAISGIVVMRTDEEELIVGGALRFFSAS